MLLARFLSDSRLRARHSPTAPAGSIVPPRVARALLVACWVAVIYGTAGAVPHTLSPRGVATWMSTAIFLATFSLVAVHRTVPALVLVSGLAAVVMQFLVPSNGAFVAVIASIALAGVRLDARSSRITAAVSGAGFLAASALSPHPLSPTAIASVVSGILFAYVGATAMRHLRIEQQRTQELLQEVVAGRDAVIRAAALDERARLAREMHDVLAHTLSALSIQLEGTRMLAEQGHDPSMVAALERASRLAREGMVEARRAVASLRGEALPGPDLLPELIREFETASGTLCHLHIVGQPVELSAEARLAMYRIAQEALTNIRKHAEAITVNLTLRYMAEGVELIVENEGVPRASSLPGGGHGLSGMRERAELLNGRLEAGPTGNGFRVWLWIPVEPSTPSAS